MEQTLTVRLKLYRPTLAKQALYRALARRTTGLANNLVEAGRPKGLTSKTAAPYLVAPLPSAVINQVLRDVQAAKKVESFKVLWPSYNNQNCRLSGWATSGQPVSRPTKGGRCGCR